MPKDYEVFQPMTNLPSYDDLRRDNDLLRQHAKSHQRDYQSLAAKLDAADRRIADLEAALTHQQEHWTELSALLKMGGMTDPAFLIGAVSGVIRTQREAEAALTEARQQLQPRLDFLMSVNSALHAVQSPWRIDLHESGQALAVPVPECHSDLSSQAAVSRPPREDQEPT